VALAAYTVQPVAGYMLEMEKVLGIALRGGYRIVGYVHVGIAASVG
jgi:glycosyltransferase A (GT-A) superfamily protein (DUF2064 family)